VRTENSIVTKSGTEEIYRQLGDLPDTENDHLYILAHNPGTVLFLTPGNSILLSGHHVIPVLTLFSSLSHSDSPRIAWPQYISMSSTYILEHKHRACVTSKTCLSAFGDIAFAWMGALGKLG
jgi:hypothetical protein